MLINGYTCSSAPMASRLPSSMFCCSSWGCHSSTWPTSSVCGWWVALIVMLQMGAAEAMPRNHPIVLAIQEDQKDIWEDEDRIHIPKECLGKNEWAHQWSSEGNGQLPYRSETYVDLDGDKGKGSHTQEWPKDIVPSEARHMHKVEWIPIPTTLHSYSGFHYVYHNWDT